MDIDRDDDRDRGDRLEAWLRRAALAYCGRYASSEANLARVLARRLERRAAAAGGEPPAGAEAMIRAAVDHCRRLGLVDDRAFAETKIAAGRRRGLSARHLAQSLAAKGVDRGTVAAALAEDGGDDRRAVLLFARRKRIGPWRRTEPGDPARELALVCRNGHAPALARWALGLDRDAAEARLAGETED